MTGADGKNVKSGGSDGADGKHVKSGGTSKGKHSADKVSGIDTHF